MKTFNSDVCRYILSKIGKNRDEEEIFVEPLGVSIFYNANYISHSEGKRCTL